MFWGVKQKSSSHLPWLVTSRSYTCIVSCALSVHVKLSNAVRLYRRRFGLCWDLDPCRNFTFFVPQAKIYNAMPFSIFFSFFVNHTHYHIPAHDISVHINHKGFKWEFVDTNINTQVPEGVGFGGGAKWFSQSRPLWPLCDPISSHPIIPTAVELFTSTKSTELSSLYFSFSLLLFLKSCNQSLESLVLYVCLCFFCIERLVAVSPVFLS